MIKKIKLIIIDVDGTMTDGGIYYDENGNELKKFNTKDAAGFLAAHHLGIKVMALTGRSCKATERRMKELSVEYFYQNIKDKAGFLFDFIKKNKLEKEEIAYIGDDLNDLSPMALAGFAGCPADSCQEIKACADYVSPILGGQGAVRDIIEYMLRERGEWEKAISDVYGFGI